MGVKELGRHKCSSVLALIGHQQTVEPVLDSQRQTSLLSFI